MLFPYFLVVQYSVWPFRVRRHRLFESTVPYIAIHPDAWFTLPCGVCVADGNVIWRIVCRGIAVVYELGRVDRERKPNNNYPNAWLQLKPFLYLYDAAA